MAAPPYRRHEPDRRDPAMRKSSSRFNHHTMRASPHDGQVGCWSRLQLAKMDERFTAALARAQHKPRRLG
jgi:hypothetical protein